MEWNTLDWQTEEGTYKLTAEEYKILLECQDSNCLSYLQKQAQEALSGSVIEFSSAAS